MQNRDFGITKEKTPESVKLILKGFISSIYANELQKQLDETLKAGEYNLILNMSQVEYLCSIGISVIINAYKAATETGGTLGIEQPSENVRKVLAITSLDKILML